MPIAQAPALHPASQIMRGRTVGVAMNECLAVGLAQPIAGGLCVNIGIRCGGLLAGLALLAQATCDLLTLLQRLG